jgi:DmsE family decaheme c-type cytochrome
MKHKCASLIIALFLIGFTANGTVKAEDTEISTNVRNIQATTQAGTYTRKGADTCIKCHDEDDDYPVFDIFKTKHGQQGDKHSPFAGLQCEACHGPGIAGPEAIKEVIKKRGHTGKVRPGQERPPILNFGANSDVPIEKQNSMCLNCHESRDHISWKGSDHENSDIACVDCHRLHTPADPVLARKTQPAVCYSCHQKQRIEFSKPSSHPLRFGQLGCMDCHKTHGSIAGDLLVKPTLNQTCYTCHAEKRGPLLWEHAPVSEDCSLCHTPHGSVHPALLTKRAPLLCQQCHTKAGHRSRALTAASLPGGSPSALLLGSSCVNCHTQVHGSNHPSGAQLMR